MKIKLDNGAKLPTRAHPDDAGLDLYCPEGGVIVLAGGGSVTIDTGLHVEIPRGYVGMIKSKSGLNVNHGIQAEGVIDSGYTGSIVVKLYNVSLFNFDICAGMKIAQLVVLPCLTEAVEEVDEIVGGERGTNGFGSTGM